MLIEGATLTAAIEDGAAVDVATVAKGTANMLKETGEIPDPIEKVESLKEIPTLENSRKILEPDMGEIQEVSLESIEQSNIEKSAANIDETAQRLRELTEDEKRKLREDNDLPENLLDAIRVDENGNYKIKCINERYKDMENPDTGIRYVEKTVTVNGVEITVVVPEFPSIFDVEIPPEIWDKGDTAIFKYCTEKLRAYLNEHPELKSNFTPEQLKAIERGMLRVPGMTWHHSETPGKMQLVDFKTHFETRHTGGDFLWCGGIR